MSDSKVVKARKRLKTIASGVSADGLTIDAARIFLGSSAPAQHFSAAFNVELNKPVLNIRGASVGFSGSTYPLIVETELIVALPGNAAQEWCDVDNLIAALRAAWLTAGSYPAGEVAAHVCDFEPLRAEVRGDQTLLRAELFVAFDNPDV